MPPLRFFGVVRSTPKCVCGTFCRCEYDVLQRDSDNLAIRTVNPRLDLRKHSPTGFAWGYSGSGPAQTALALLCAVLDDDAAAIVAYQTFKDQVIAWFPADRPWTLDADTIRNWHKSRVFGRL